MADTAKLPAPTVPKTLATGGKLTEGFNLFYYGRRWDELSEDPKAGGVSLDYTGYPRKSARAHAFKMYLTRLRRACKRELHRGKTWKSVDRELGAHLAQCAHFQTHWPEGHGLNHDVMRFCPHAGTWMNGENDYDERPR